MYLEFFIFKTFRLFSLFGLVVCYYTISEDEQQLYPSPCPGIFRYKVDQHGELYGTILVYSYVKNFVILNVELSVGNSVNNHTGQIELTYPKERVLKDIIYQIPVKYKLHFPRWENIPPKVTKIAVNGNVVCTGPPFTNSWSDVLTTINLQHTLPVQTENHEGYGRKDCCDNLKSQVLNISSINSSASNFSSVKNTSADICGTSNVSNSSVSIPRGAFPWLAAIFKGTRSGLQYTCGGSLISKKHIVTAAHCVDKRLHANPDTLVCKLSLSESEKIIEVDDVYVHPDFTPLTSDADIAMVILSEEVEYTRYIRPICLWSEPDDLAVVIGEKGIVTGWGNTMLSEPKQATIITQQECLQSVGAYRYVTSPRTFCADDRNGTESCTSGAGSSFVMKRSGKWMLRGVVSIAVFYPNNQTCDLSNYVVFTDVSKFKMWILSFILE